MKLCELCLVRRAVDRHHRLPRSRGGPDDEHNLVDLCRGCHRWAEDHPEEARERGLTIPGFMLLGGYVGPNEDYAERYGRPPG